MSSKREFIGVFDLAVEKRDGSKENRKVFIHKKGSSVFLDDGIGVDRLSDILVHPSNQGSQEGWIREYALCRDVKVIKYSFTLPGAR
jgi:hypothetical protein